MSQSKHRSYRKILSIEKSTVKLYGQDFRLTKVLWCAEIESVTSRSVKAKHIALSCYLGRGLKLKVVDARFPKKPVTLNLKNPEKSKFFDNGRLLQSMFQDCCSDLTARYLETLRDLDAEVLFFDKRSGEGIVNVLSLNRTFEIYACNLKDARTWYASTACVFLNEGQRIKIDKITSGLVVAKSEGFFDAEKWVSLDQDSLAFKVDIETGKLKNGLFA